MASRWYYGQDEEKNGPCTDQELRNLADAGQITPTDTIWKEGVEQGVMANRVKNLFPLPEADASLNNAGGPATKVHPVSVAEAEPLPVSQATTPQPEPPLVEESTEKIADQATPQPEPSPGPSAAADSATASELPPQEEMPAAPVKPVPPPQKVKTKRAVAGKGAMIIGQDGIRAKVRKKCIVCSKEDSSFATILIKNGTNRISFFCTKCKRRREVEVQGITN